ncbi:phosphoribosylglycinamide formyltransferase [Trichocoleus sp. FACHB-262]|uniref:phosphoribosylglycinamide formyltransferase n=1 Tax=Trichocoleus sp. FACHB-262 TaxID=2692869 RepID=UPI001681CE47|nr:phosphoribosylglycinamide formyltransferase [Trichocoleus sp. FACHB-262]MBD2119595.1 phosphoribosylglycinamide formyltransferase [Trichocoleus sp. FACHB-262]
MTSHSAVPTSSPDSIPSLVSPILVASTFATPAATPLKLGVMASGSGSNFEAIAQAIADGQLHAKIPVLICNNRNAKALERAERWGIPSVLLDHRTFASREDLDRQIAETLKQHGVEWVIMAGWMRRVTQVLIDAFPDQMLNIHPSLLPSFPGIRAVEQALQSGVKISGCTVHYVHLEVDSGPIVMQAAVPILAEDTPATLQARIQVQEHRIFPPAIALAAAQRAGVDPTTFFSTPANHKVS